MRTLSFLRTLGAGAFGTVYLAEFSSGRGFRRQVAVKVLLKDRPDSEMFLSRIRDEARLLGLLQDDAILKVLDMVQVNRQDAVIMEYVEGVDLDSVVNVGQAPSPRALAELGASVAGALSRAHTAAHPATGVPLNVIHRDVKPANIMVTSSGGVKLLDFGVARARFDARESRTGQFMLGTLNYMAPEYVVTGEVSTAADIYGLALSLWQVAAGDVYGQPKLRENEHVERLRQNLDRIRTTHAQLTPILERMMTWEPTSRPTAATVERELTEAADELVGSGLRSWSRRVVPAVLAGRKAAPDAAGLLGHTVPVGNVVQQQSSQPTLKAQGGVGTTAPDTVESVRPRAGSAPSGASPASDGRRSSASRPTASAPAPSSGPRASAPRANAPRSSAPRANPPKALSSPSSTRSSTGKRDPAATTIQPQRSSRSPVVSPSRPPSRAPSRPSAKSSNRALIATVGIILQGLLIGGMLGLVGVVGLALFLFLIR